MAREGLRRARHPRSTHNEIEDLSLIRCAYPGCDAVASSARRAIAEGWATDQCQWWCPGLPPLTEAVARTRRAPVLVTRLPVDLSSWRRERLSLALTEMLTDRDVITEGDDR